MTFLRRLLIVSGCVASIACGGAAASSEGDPSQGPALGGPPGTSTTAPGASGRDVCTGVATGAPTCEAAVDVGTVEALIDAMASAPPFDQRVVGAAPAASQAPTRDVRVTADLVADVAAFRAKAPRCAAETDAEPTRDRCSETLFAQEKTFQVIRTIYGTLGDAFAPGVTCLEEEAPGVGCRRVAIAAGSVVRFQMVREKNLFAGTTKNYLRIVRACASPCAEGETRCADSNLCVKSGSDFCILCEGKSELECACRVGCGLASNGTSCGASTSEDTVVSGTCRSGRCEETR